MMKLGQFWRKLSIGLPLIVLQTKKMAHSQKPLLSAFESLLISGSASTLKIWPCFGRTFLIEHGTAAQRRLIWFRPQIDNGSAKSRGLVPRYHIVVQVQVCPRLDRT